ncbi:hypothetical protein ACI2JA_04095 [Alkalihalobacillus sp. NPDC078783]
MDYYDAYAARMNAKGASKRDVKKNNTERMYDRKIRNSPTSASYLLDDTPTLAIVSYEKRSNPFTTQQTFQRTFQFESTAKASLGSVISDDENTYIIYDKSDIDILPPYYALKTNDVLDIEFEPMQIDTGRKDGIGRPIYETIELPDLKLDCFVTENARVSESADFNNRPVVLPEGRLNVLISNPNQEIELGKIVELSIGKYKVLGVNKLNANGTKGYITLLIDNMQAALMRTGE